MWPFRRKVEAPPADGPRPVPAPVIRRDWAGLPPIQRFVGAHPLTAPSDQFSDDLATHQDPSVSTDTMGHQVSAEAPPGLVLALARPTTRSDGPAMIPRPRVQRSVAGAVAESGEWDGDEAAPDLTRPTPLPISAPAVATRELPVVAPEPAIQRLTSLAPDAEPTPVPSVQRSRAVPTAPTLSSPTDEPFEIPASPPRLTLGQSRRLGLGAPIKQVPDHGVQRAVSDSMPLAPSPVTTVPEMAREPMDASTAARVPMDASPGMRMPMDTVVQRVPMDLPLSGKVPIDLSSGVKEARASTLGVPPALDASEEPRLDLPLARPPIVPPAPSVQLSATSSAEPTTESSITAPPAVQRFADGDSPTRVERGQSMNIGDLPMASMPGVSISSLPLRLDAPARVPIAATSAPPARGAIAPLASARSLKPTATLQRSNAPTVTLPQRGREDQELPEGEGVHPTPPFRQMGTEDAPTLSFLQRASEDLSTRTLTLPQTEDPAQGGRELPSTRGREDQRTTQPLPLAPSRGFAVQRASQAVNDLETEPTEFPTDSGGPLVQGAWYDSISAGVGSMTSGAAASGASAGGSAVGSAIGGVASSLGSHKDAETDMDELAGKLYDRIRSRLKTELLVDRERAGFLTDLR